MALKDEFIAELKRESSLTKKMLEGFRLINMTGNHMISR